MYQAYWQDGASFSPMKIICVARNYREHAKEMGGEAPSNPIFFLKPRTSIASVTEAVTIPAWTNDFQHEIELAVCIAKGGSNIPLELAKDYVGGLAVGIDFTARDLQQKRKQAGMPWDQAKGFDGACLLSHFIKSDNLELNNLKLELSVNGVIKQRGNTSEMVHDVCALISEASRFFTLEQGDIILTGTPAGVAALEAGDYVKATIESIGNLEFMVKR